MTMQQNMQSQDKKLLLIDSGNTAVKWQVLDAKQPIADRIQQTRLATVHRMENTQLSVAELTRAFEVSLQDTRSVEVSWASVGPAQAKACIAEAFYRAARAEIGEPWQAAPALVLTDSRGGQLSLRNHYREPSQLGADRWACVAGLSVLAELSAGDTHMIVSAGTATTIDLVSCAVSGQIEFLGGWIWPGVGLMNDALQHGTRNLQYSIKEQSLDLHVPLDSESAISQGIGLAQTSMIHAIVSRYGVTRLWLHGGHARLWHAAMRQLTAVNVPVEHCPALIFSGLAALGSGRAK